MIAPPILLGCRHAVMLGVMLGCTGITQAPRRVARDLPVTRRHQLRLPSLPVDLPGNRLHQRPVHVSLRSASAHHGGWRAARVHRPRRHAVVSSPPDRTRLPGGPDRRSLWNELLVRASSPPGPTPPSLFQLSVNAHPMARAAMRATPRCCPTSCRQAPWARCAPLLCQPPPCECCPDRLSTEKRLGMGRAKTPDFDSVCCGGAGERGDGKHDPARLLHRLRTLRLLF